MLNFCCASVDSLLLQEASSLSPAEVCYNSEERKENIIKLAQHTKSAAGGVAANRGVAGLEAVLKNVDASKQCDMDASHSQDSAGDQQSTDEQVADIPAELAQVSGGRQARHQRWQLVYYRCYPFVCCLD